MSHIVPEGNSQLKWYSEYYGLQPIQYSNVAFNNETEEVKIEELQSPSNEDLKILGFSQLEIRTLRNQFPDFILPRTILSIEHKELLTSIYKELFIAEHPLNENQFPAAITYLSKSPYALDK